MLAKILSGTVNGVNGLLVEVEVDIANGLPAFATVGLPEASVRESKDRVKAAITNSGYKFPNRRITVNLAPADLRKAGTAYDLPIALGLLAAAEILKSTTLQDYLVVGELSLDGSVRSVNGILPIILAARDMGLKGVLLSSANVKEGAVVKGIDVIGVSTLSEAVEFLANLLTIAPVSIDFQGTEATAVESYHDFSEVKGQEQVKRALEIAASGGHNILMEGPPGAGKTMLARRLPTILPSLTFDEALETTKIYSVSGMLDKDRGLITTRPFRAPHHTISDAGLIGGGQFPRPGEVSLAHNGVLFLDELAEYRKNVLEGLRQPLEDGTVTISRASTSISFPANFVLIGAMNPCPCGYSFSQDHQCNCTSIQIQRYKSRISGPLLDRFDMHIEVPAVGFKKINSQLPTESSQGIKKRVDRARKIQAERYKNRKKIHCNAQMSPRDIRKCCVLDTDSQNILETAVEKLALSARAYNRILKLARTIADIDQSADVKSGHIAEAVQYRRMDARGMSVR